MGTTCLAILLVMGACWATWGLDTPLRDSTSDVNSTISDEPAVESGDAPVGSQVSVAGSAEVHAEIEDEPTAVASPLGSGQPAAGASVPEGGSGILTYGANGGPILGTAGTLRRFHVAVENDMGQDVDTFGAALDTILGDPRSWIAGQDVRFQRVGNAEQADFTIVLATPATSETLCAAGGLKTAKYTSCRVSSKVVINLARWLTATPSYGAPVEVYQAYAVNHEVGHLLGHGHEGCPNQGSAAPVMLQQTLDLRGCVANGWPYVDGHLYSGPRVS